MTLIDESTRIDKKIIHVQDKIILELKAVSELNKIFEAQLLSYLKATGMKLGVLLNFGGKKVEYKRIVN